MKSWLCPVVQILLHHLPLLKLSQSTLIRTTPTTWQTPSPNLENKPTRSIKFDEKREWDTSYPLWHQMESLVLGWKLDSNWAYQSFNGVPPQEFIRISTCDTSKEAWDILCVTHVGTKKVKRAKLQQLVIEFENRDPLLMQITAQLQGT